MDGAVRSVKTGEDAAIRKDGCGASEGLWFRNTGGEFERYVPFAFGKFEHHAQAKWFRAEKTILFSMSIVMDGYSIGCTNMA